MFTPGQNIKTFTSNKGNSIVVRLPLSSDVDQMLLYINKLVSEDTFIRRAPGDFLTLEEEKQWFEPVLSEVQEGKRIALFAFCKNKIIGNCEVTIDRFRLSHVGELHVSVDKDFREDGVGQELIKLAIEKAKEVNLKLLTLTCFANNLLALHVYEKLGFQESGRIPMVYSYKGGYVDEVKMYLKLV